MQITETQLDQLTPETTYRVEVLALTSDGKNSPPSDWVEFTTEHDSGKSHNFEPFSCRSKTPFYLLKPISRVFFNYSLEIDSGSLRSSTLLYASCFYLFLVGVHYQTIRRISFWLKKIKK